MLRKKTFQNKIAASRYALPITATLAALVWVAVGFIECNIWLNFAFTIISTLLMVELNNRNSLMRTYSRMVSCSFLVLVTMTCLPTPSYKANIVSMCFIAFYLIIWNSYQDVNGSAGWTFYAFSCIGLASMVFIQIRSISYRILMADDDGIHQFLQYQQLPCLTHRHHRPLLVHGRLLRLHRQSCRGSLTISWSLSTIMSCSTTPRSPTIRWSISVSSYC